MLNNTPRRFQDNESTVTLVTEKFEISPDRGTSGINLEEDIWILRFSRTLQALKEVLEECSHDNWDGYGAKAVDRKSLDKALQIVLSLPLEIPPPDVGVDPDGEISLEWYRNPRRIFSISVGGDGTLTYAGILGDEEVHGKDYWKGRLPQGILDKIKKVYMLSSHDLFDRMSGRMGGNFWRITIQTQNAA